MWHHAGSPTTGNLTETIEAYCGATSLAKKVIDDVLFWTFKLQLDIVRVHPKDTISVTDSVLLISFFLDWTLSALILRLEFALYLGEKGFEIIAWITSRLRLNLNTFQDLLVLEVGSIWNQQKNHLRLFRRFLIYLVKGSG